MPLNLGQFYTMQACCGKCFCIFQDREPQDIPLIVHFLHNPIILLVA